MTFKKIENKIYIKYILTNIEFKIKYNNFILDPWNTTMNKKKLRKKKSTR